MLRILLADDVAKRLRKIVDVADKSTGGSSKRHALSSLHDELHTPLTPPSYAGKGATYPAGTVVSHERLLEVAAWARGRGHGAKSVNDVLAVSDVGLAALSLDSLLRGAQVAIAIRPKPVRSPELIESLRKIELAQQEKEYKEMLAGATAPQHTRQHHSRHLLHRTTEERAREAEEWQEVRRQLGAIANVGLSVAAVVTAVWWAGGTASPIFKTLVAMPIALLVAVAEVALYSRHWTNLQKRSPAGSRLPRRTGR